jgi:hypothetical protein
MFPLSQVPSFPELQQAIDTAIARLGGTVVPKLNWSCPKDTAWVSPTGSVKCNNAAEVLLLLKSSDVIVHDLCHAFDNCSDGGVTRPEHFVLVLKKWYPLRPEMEFRCFVRDNQLRGTFWSRWPSVAVVLSLMGFQRTLEMHDGKEVAFFCM